ncbi:SCP1.201-like deaminase [Prauserella aidingensis]|uniref:DddA-like double-stranded DNA deaminase toxin n=1 Tax=Prauserella aidingensis TaxID=387890 RepID=UPI0020A3497B|nr:DddA-like double-stranded DNA deaminase toxin [Prauserella aidingensis]MCP2255217.1 SCP1.201-like deaminase [Prauserella aidingensis]
MSVEQLAEIIGRVLDQIAAARAALAHASQATVEARDLYAYCLDGAHVPDAAQAPGVAAEAVEQVDRQHGRLAKIEQTLRGYLDQLGATVAQPAARASQPPAPAESASVAEEVTAADGSRYPAAAGWCADMLPRRVREGQAGERTTGYADGSLTPFRSGNDDTWSPAIRQRIVELGLPARRASFLASHVEMKVATMMITTGRRHSELVINHVPCGSQPRQASGCHQYLARYLPEGYSLTVRGTTQDGTPYSHTYEGTA